MGAEIEYLASDEDKRFHSVSEYYSRMREVNSILLPGSNILDSLMVLKEIIQSLDKKLKNTLATRAWPNGYGFAYNGVHLHLSGKLDKEILTKNIFRLMAKHGLSPRTVTSWHIFNRPSNYSFKNRNKHQPIYKTPRGTLEIRVLDLEYFLDDEIIKDLAVAIDMAYAGKLIDGDDTWVSRLLDINLDKYKDCCEFLDSNMAKNWEKIKEGHYINKVGRYDFNFTALPDWREEEPEDEYSDDDGVEIATPRRGRGRSRPLVDFGEPVSAPRPRDVVDFDDSPRVSPFSSRWLDDTIIRAGNGGDRNE